MNPNSASSKESGGLNLPPPVAGGEQLPMPAEQRSETAPETAPAPAAAAELAPSSAVAGAAAAQPAIPLPPIDDNSGTSTQSDVSSTSKSSTKKLIKDDDLIEKEWVDRAKRIVEQTRDDPHEQSDQLNGVKVDYMKQHYDKTIKVNK